MKAWIDSSAWTVAQRELRESSRRPANYRLRVASGLAVAAMLWWTLRYFFEGMETNGMILFGRVHCLILILTIAIVPGLAADCIAREEREGTLGFLVLTPLTARGIVFGKSLAQGLRALTLWLATLPALTVVFLTGGVIWTVVAHMATQELCVGVVCLAGGLAASALIKSRHGAFLLAYTLAGVMLAGLAIFEAGIRTPINDWGGWRGASDLLNDGISMATGEEEAQEQTVLLRAIAGGLVPRNLTFSQYAKLYGWGVPNWSATMEVALIGSGLALYAAFTVAATMITKRWKDRPTSQRRAEMTQRYCTPLSPAYFHSWTQRSLDRNPIAWLQQHSLKARLSKWGSCGLIVAVETAALLMFNVSGSELVFDMQSALAVLLALGLTVFAVSGFLDEAQSGALELILVTPISINRFITGRLWGLWKQFLPAALILCAAEIAVGDGLLAGHGRQWRVSEDTLSNVFVAANAFLALPILATYCALRVKNVIGAGALTWAAMLLLWAATWGVMAADRALRMSLEWDYWRPMPYVTLALINAILIGLTLFLLHRRLLRRQHAF